MTPVKTIFHGFYVYENLGQRLYKQNSGQMKEKLKLYCKCGVMFEAFSYDIQYGVVKYCGACKNVAKARENIKETFLTNDSIVRAFRWRPVEGQGSGGEIQIVYTIGDRKLSTKIRSKVNTYNIKRWSEPTWQKKEPPKEEIAVESKTELENKGAIMPTNEKSVKNVKKDMQEIEIAKMPETLKGTTKVPEVLSKGELQNIPQQDSKALSLRYAKEELDLMNSLSTSNEFLHNLAESMVNSRQDLSTRRIQAHEIEGLVSIGREIRENNKLKLLVIRQAREFSKE